MALPFYIPDRPAADDSFDRSHFAAALSHSLLLPKGSPGLVVGIEGNWGSGKSTLIGFVTKSLAGATEGNVPIVVEFNPWMVSNTGALVEALIGQIAASIGKDISVGDKGIAVGQKLLGYVGLLKHLKYLKYIPALSWAGHIAADIPEIAQVVAATADQGEEAGQKAIEGFKKILPSLDLQQQRDQVVQALDDLDRPIVIVIDDLDRLPVEEIRSMIQAIKAVADFPRVTYLLAYDRSIIARALAADEASGLAYLEKIVQVAYPIPPLSQRQLNHFADEKIQTLLSDLKITLRPYEQERYGEAIALATKLARHPRDIVRLVNRLVLSLPATHEEVNAADVIVFEAISQHSPALRESIYKHSVDFIGHPFRGDLIDEKDAFDSAYWRAMSKDDAECAWLKHLPNGEHESLVLKKACEFIFPEQQSSGESSAYEDALRIADPDRLARLFRMTSLEEVPEAKEMHELLMAPEKLGIALAVEDNQQLLFLLEWLNNYAPSCPSLDVKGCVEKMVEVSGLLTSQCRLVDEVANRFADLMTRLLRQKAKGYFDCFMYIAQRAPISISEKIVWLAATEQGKWRIRPEGKVGEEHQLISDGALVDQAIQVWSNRVRECSANGRLHQEANLHSILYRLAQLNNDAYDEVYGVIRKMCESENGLAAFLRQYKEDAIRYDDRLTLVEDAEKLSQRISESTHKEKYLWLVQWLRKEEVIQSVKENAEKLKHPKS